LVSIDEVGDPLSDRRISALFELEESQATAAQKALLGAIQDAPHARWTGLLLAVSNTRDALLFEQVALAMAKIEDARFVPILIPRLDIRDGRGSVREALVAQGSLRSTHSSARCTRPTLQTVCACTFHGRYRASARSAPQASWSNSSTTRGFPGSCATKCCAVSGGWSPRLG
jgi:HEAT repeat protein